MPAENPILLTVGDLQANCYVAFDPASGRAVIIDPGAEAARIAAAVEEAGLTPELVFLTHGHYDHIGAVEELRDRFGIPLAAHREEISLLGQPTLNLSWFFNEAVRLREPEIVLEHGSRVKCGALEGTALWIPGHSPGGAALYFPDLDGGAVFTGDALFAGSVGRTDFPGGSMETLLKGIREHLLVLPPETKVYPGHGPATTIGEEAASNPYLVLDEDGY